METTEIIIPETEFYKSKYSTHEWEISVNILCWEHDFENKIYKIKFKSYGNK